MKILPRFLLTSNPFFQAYWEADFLGKAIFVGLLIVSIISWSLILYKLQMFRQVRSLAQDFLKRFQHHTATPLNIEYQHRPTREFPHPFYSVYRQVADRASDLLKKNQRYGNGSAFLTAADLDVVEMHLSSSISGQRKLLDRHLFILSTIVALAPFLGLLGTVWGILNTFGGPIEQLGASKTMLSGLSLALTTTVLGLINAIPALIGYRYFQNFIREFQVDLDEFGHQALSCIELAYRRVEAE